MNTNVNTDFSIKVRDIYDDNYSLFVDSYENLFFITGKLQESQSVRDFIVYWNGSPHGYNNFGWATPTKWVLEFK
jgi:hypothetical protein